MPSHRLCIVGKQLMPRVWIGVLVSCNSTRRKYRMHPGVFDHGSARQLLLACMDSTNYRPVPPRASNAACRSSRLNLTDHQMHANKSGCRQVLHQAAAPHRRMCSLACFTVESLLHWGDRIKPHCKPPLQLWSCTCSSALAEVRLLRYGWKACVPMFAKCLQLECALHFVTSCNHHLHDACLCSETCRHALDDTSSESGGGCVLAFALK